MATPRKPSSGKSKSSGKTAKPAKVVKKSKAPSAKRPPAAPAKSAPAKSAPAKPVAAKPVPLRGKPAPVAKPVVAAPVKPGKPMKPGKPGKPGARPAGIPVVPGKPGAPRRVVAVSRAAPEVRPLGVLPPGSIAKSVPKPAAPPVARPAAPARPQGSSAPPAPDQRVTEKDFKEFELRLLEERKKIMKEMGHLENTVLKVNQRDSAGDLSGYSFHMADVGTDSMEREKAFLFASVEGRTLLEINEALRRLYRGEYGSCESCGQPISKARLAAMPNARLCVSCKEKEERSSRGAT